jgi:hypothetical protein
VDDASVGLDKYIDLEQHIKEAEEAAEKAKQK